jgi:hypothetical protein
VNEKDKEEEVGEVASNEKYKMKIIFSNKL